MRIVQGAILGAGFKFFISFVGLIKGALEGATLLGGRIFYFGGDVSPALVAVGYIVGLNVAALIFIGGAIAWLVEIPLLSAGFVSDGEPLDAAWSLWSTQIRYTGVGAMVLGGIVSIFKVRHGLVQAVAQLRKSAGFGVAENADPLDRDLPSSVILGFSALATLLVAGVYYHLTKDFGITALITVVMIVMSFFFTAVASYIVGLVGNSNSPVSGMTITAVLFTGFLILIFGYTGLSGMAATLGVAAIVCCAACTSGDVCNDLKTGALVGASPFRQQIMQIAGVAAAALVMAPILQLLHDHTPGGIGGRELAAPQAALFASLAKGFFGDGTIPWNLVGVGVGIGLVLLFLDSLLARRRSEFRLHLMPIAVGMYLPFGLATPIFIGGLLSYFITRGLDETRAEERSRPGVLFSSGVIAGESLMGVGLAILASVGIQRLGVTLSPSTETMLTVVAALGCVYAFRRVSVNRRG